MEHPDIEYYFKWNEETGELEFYRNGRIRIALFDLDLQYNVPQRLTKIEIGKTRFLRCHLLGVKGEYGLEFRFEDYEKIERETDENPDTDPGTV